MISSKLLMLVGITLLRSVAVAGAACMIGSLLGELLKTKRARVFIIGWLLIPLLMPALVIGYAYADFSLSLIRRPLLNELFYALLLVMRLSPLAAIVLLLAPRPVSAMGNHCGQLARQMPRKMRIKLYLQGQGRALLITWAACFIYCFTEFDIASRMGTRVWVVWVFDTQAGGKPIGQTVISVLLPILLQLLIAFGALAMLRQPTDHAQPTAHRPIRKAVAWLWSVAAFVGVCVVPGVFVLTGALGAMGSLLQNGSIHKELWAGSFFSLTAGTIAVAIALLLRSRSKYVLLPFAAPGLAGSLVVGLVLLGAFGSSALRPFYDTPLPLLMALVLVVFPIVLLLAVLLHRHWQTPANHLRKLLSHSDRKQHRQTARSIFIATRFGSLALVWLFACWLCYVELPASALLAPTGMTPAVVRLYNLMHYGRSDTLSAMVLLTYLLPLTLPIAMLVIGRLFRGAAIANA